jgi:hypothetical protein
LALIFVPRERQATNLQQAGLAAQRQDFHEQQLHVPQVTLAKLGDPPKVRNVVPHNHALAPHPSRSVS